MNFLSWVFFGAVGVAIGAWLEGNRLAEKHDAERRELGDALAFRAACEPTPLEFVVVGCSREGLVCSVYARADEASGRRAKPLRVTVVGSPREFCRSNRSPSGGASLGARARPGGAGGSER